MLSKVKERKRTSFFFFLGISERFKRGPRKEAHDEEGWYILWGPGSKKQKFGKAMPMLSTVFAAIEGR